jgi:hypothetical protein
LARRIRIWVVFGLAVVGGIWGSSLLLPEAGEPAHLRRSVEGSGEAHLTDEPLPRSPQPGPTPTSVVEIPSPSPAPGYYSAAEQVARNFLQAYTSFDWRDPQPSLAVRERTRPWATDSLNRFLDTGSSAAHLTEQRVLSQEVATLEIVSMDPVSPRGEDLVTFTSLGLNHKQVNGPTPEPRAQFYELTVVRQGGRWLVDRIRL